MGRATRPRPKYLGKKLKAIRIELGFSQTEMLIALGYANDQKDFRSVISAYELGKREPNLIELLKYSRLSGVYLEIIVDDKMQLPFLNKN
jgi:transcriptional regulator with XRE-family HTH domain